MKSALTPNRSLAIMAWVLTTAGCGSGDLGIGSSGSSSGSSANSSAAGIWTGTDSASGLSLTGIIDASGVANFLRSDGTQYSGTVQVSGTSLAIALDVTTQVGSQFGDGSTYGVGTFNATVTTGSAISGNVTFTTSNNSAISSTWSLTFDSLYNNPSSLTDISGNYTDDFPGDPLNGATVAISGTGAMTAQSASTGCVMNGQVSIPDTTHNAYAISYTLENCAGNDSVLNGIAFTGVSVVDSALSPQQVVIGVRGQNASGANYGIVSGLTLN